MARQEPAERSRSAAQAAQTQRAAETTTHHLLLATLWQTGGRVQELLRLRPSDLLEAVGAIALTILEQRRRAQRGKLVSVNPDLLGRTRDAMDTPRAAGLA